MVKIRLRRVGAKKQTSFRIVVADSRAPRDGRYIERIGIYNPRTDPETVVIDEERALHWLDVGAQPTDSVARIFKSHGTWARFERLRQGEPLEALVAEAEAALVAEEEGEAQAETEEPTAMMPEAETEEDETEEAEEESEAESEPASEVEESAEDAESESEEEDAEETAEA